MWTGTSRKSVKRFSYLLLEDGDQYIQDWIVTCRRALVGPGAQKVNSSKCHILLLLVMTWSCDGLQLT
jgi:factor associated with neutral sphingomyelinase activation